MHIRQLAYLVSLAHERHFAHAAERCAISQPALSLALKALEVEFGVAIVLRGHRFAGFTREGELVLAWARGVLRDQDVLTEQLRSSAGALSGRIRLGVIPSATALSAKLVAAFCAKHPDVCVADLEMTSVDIGRALQAFELEAGITYIDNEPLDHIRAIPVGTEEYVFVTPEDSPLAEFDEIAWTSAAAVPLCLLHRDMQNRRIIEAIFESVGARPAARIETNSMIGKYRYLQLGWSSIMPRSLVEWLRPPPHMRVLPLVEPTITKALGLISVDQLPPSPILEAFRGLAAAALP